MNNTEYVTWVEMELYEKHYKDLMNDEDILDVVTDNGKEYIAIDLTLMMKLEEMLYQKRLYNFNADNMTEEEYEDRLNRARKYDPAYKNDAKYIVSKIIEREQGGKDYVPYIDKHMILPIVEEMHCNEDGFFSDKYRYDFICEHWSSLEDGYALEDLAWYMEEYRYGCEENDITKQLRKQLKKQMDKDGYITVYRGFHDYTNEEGHSYTLSRNVAIWYSRRFSKEISYVNTYRIHIGNVMAFITNRGEAEIIASPHIVELLETNSYSDKEIKISAGCKVEFINN